VDAAEAARLWIEAWETGWRAHDPAPIVARYAAAAEFRSHPFREPEDPRAYVERAFAEEESVPDVWFGEPIVSGDRAAVEYRATVRYEERDHELAGVTLLRFDNEGLVVEHRDYWALEPAHEGDL
jgi:hypothetical protein